MQNPKYNDSWKENPKMEKLPDKINSMTAVV